jgi:hypothetical protein
VENFNSPPALERKTSHHTGTAKKCSRTDSNARHYLPTPSLGGEDRIHVVVIMTILSNCFCSEGRSL